MMAVLMDFCQLTACAPAEENPSGTDTNTAGTNSESNVADTAKKVLTMATNASFQPYEYHDAEGNIMMQIAAAIAEKLGMELKIEDMQFNSIINSVEFGAVDFGMAGMTVTDEREEKVNFSNTYATGKQAVITMENSEVKSPDDLAGKKIGVWLGTTGDNYATADYGLNEDETLNGNVIQYKNGNEAVLVLIGGDVQAVIIDNEPAKSLVAANEGKGLIILETEYVYEEYSTCVKKEYRSSQ